MAPSDPEILPESLLQTSELSDAEALVREAGWNQLIADWRIFLELGVVYAVRDNTHRVIATAATLVYGGQAAWISMVLVAGDHRRRGIATRLLRRCVDELVGRGLTPVLDATPDGRGLYIRLGFQEAWGFQRYWGSSPHRDESVSPTPDGVVIRSIRDDEWPMLWRYDAQAFGADRSAVLTRLRGRAPRAQLAAWRGEHMIGFLLGRDGRSATQLGPVVADDEAAARALLGLALTAADGPIYIDLVDNKSALRQWMEARGFSPQRSFMRMVYGSVARIGDVARTMAVAGPELG